MPIEREIACVILRDAAGNIAMQHRDNLPHIASPNEWCIFGGGVEDGETTAVAAIREIFEEINLELNDANLQPVGSFYHKPGRVFHIFCYETDGLFASAKLGEGQDWGMFSAENILTGTLKNHKVVPHHLVIIDWFINQHLPNHQL